MRSSPSFHTPSFLIGVAATLSAAFFASQIQERRRQRNEGKRRGRSPSNREGNVATVKSSSSEELYDAPDLDLRLIRKAEAVVRGRTSSITIVVERCTNDHNYSAILRTAEALGIQNVWIVDPPTITDSNTQDEGGKQPSAPIVKLTVQEMEDRQKHRLFAQNATEWLTIREFETSTHCLEALRQTGHEVWVTDLSQQAECLTREGLQRSGHWPLPDRLAIVFGTEAVGCSQEMLDNGDLRVYLPLRGFADSLNLSVATALVIQQLFVLEPNYVGDMNEEERNQLRQAWFPKLARQRLLSSGEKKKRRKLLTAIQKCENLQAKQDAGHSLTPEQLENMAKVSEHRLALSELEEASHLSGDSVVDRAVADLVQHPPDPLTDLRRADPHRVTFVGRNIKKYHQDHWKDLHAVGKYQSEVNSTASFFRERVAAEASANNERTDE